MVSISIASREPSRIARALAEGAVDLRQSGVERFLLVRVHRGPVGNDVK